MIILPLNNLSTKSVEKIVENSPLFHTQQQPNITQRGKQNITSGVVTNFSTNTLHNVNISISDNNIQTTQIYPLFRSHI